MSAFIRYPDKEQAVNRGIQDDEAPARYWARAGRKKVLPAGCERVMEAVARCSDALDGGRDIAILTRNALRVGHVTGGRKVSTRRPVHAVPLVAGLIVVIVTVMLGNWQLRRAAEKTELQMQIVAGARSMPVALETNDEPAEWRIVALRGEWLPAGTIYLDNRVYGGRAGYHVLTPLQLEDGSRPVLVNRGWVAMGANRLTRPSIETPAGPVQLEGTVRWPERKPFTLAAQAGQGELWQYIDLEDFREWSGAPVRDWIVQQSSASADALVREWPRPDTGIDQHRGYAFQWYGLAGVASVMAGVYVFRSRRTHAA